MKKKLTSLLLLGLAWLYPAAYMAGADATAESAAPVLSPQPDQSSVDQAVAYVLTHYHYSREPLDPALSAKIFDEYLKELDGGHDYFLKADIDSFADYRDGLAASIKKGDLTQAFAIYTLFRQRFDARMAYAQGLLDKQPDLKSDETLAVSDSPEDWAVDQQQLDERWRKRIKNEVIDLMLDGNDWPKTAKLLKRRYSTLAEGMAKISSDDVFGTFMNAYAKALDPHTEYFAPVEYQQFKTQMSLKLEGIGVELQGDEDYVKIGRVLPGSPASRSGLLHVGDRIASVAQGESGDFVDVAGWRLDDVVRLTRGTKRHGLASHGPAGGRPSGFAAETHPPGA